MRPKVLIIDNFDSFTYNLYQYCAEVGAQVEVFHNNEITLAQIQKKKYTHILLSPGPGSPVHAKDFGICGQIIEKLQKKIPILGVCLGHQGIIYHCGGKIEKAPVPIHGKQSLIELDQGHPLFKGLPKCFKVMRYHSLVGERKSLPSSLKVIAETVDDHIIMAVSHIKNPLYGVQFHPESIGTEYGKRILKNFLK